MCECDSPGGNSHIPEHASCHCALTVAQIRRMQTHYCGKISISRRRSNDCDELDKQLHNRMAGRTSSHQCKEEYVKRRDDSNSSSQCCSIHGYTSFAQHVLENAAVEKSHSRYVLGTQSLCSTCLIRLPSGAAGPSSHCLLKFCSSKRVKGSSHVVEELI